MAVQTQIQTRRGTAATWTSTNPTLAAGEIGFESDTGKFKIGTGSTAWASLAYATNGAVVSPLTTKGDLFTYSTTNARLAVGNNGESLVADSSTSTGLRYQAPKTQNAVYNSGFDIAQRGTSFTALAGADYTLDRWVWWSTSGGQSNYASQQSVGNLSVSPNQAIRYCGRFGRTSGTTNTGGRQLFQSLETADSVRLAGQTVTFSYYARAGANFSAGSSQISAEIVTGTGTDQIKYSYTGGSQAGVGTATLTTSWQRFSVTATLATTTTEVSVGFLWTPTGTAGAADYFEITGVQLEVGSVATPYNRMSGTIQGELAACQRYYYRNTPNYAYAAHAIGGTTSTTVANALVFLPVPLRVNATSVEYSNLLINDTTNNGAITSLTIQNTGYQVIQISATASGGGLTAYRPYSITNNSGTSGYLGFSAEL